MEQPSQLSYGNIGVKRMTYNLNDSNMIIKYFELCADKYDDKTQFEKCFKKFIDAKNIGMDYLQSEISNILNK
jgi:hypothetical protein